MMNEQECDVPGRAGVSDVLVVGGGLAGLTAVLGANRTGASVALLDAHALGGRAKSAERNGFILNEGGHALHNGAGRAILDEFGVSVRGASPDTASSQFVWEGEIVPLPMTPTALMRTPLLGLRSKAKLSAIFASLNLKLPDDSMSVDDWLDQRGVRPDLHKYLIAMLRLGSYAANPGTQPAGMMFRQLLAGQAGVVYVDGGWQGVVDDLRRLAVAAGVSIIDHHRVSSIRPEGQGWIASTDSHEYRAKAVVVAVGGPSQAVSLLGEDGADWVERAGEPQRAACLDIGGEPGRSTFLLSADEPLYLSLHAPVADLAPGGSHLYSVMRYLDGEADRSAVRNRAELERHANNGGLPCVTDRVVDRLLAAPVVSWGRPTVGRQRPTGLERASEGVFAAGDWMSEQLLADASIVSGAASGRAAAMHAARRTGTLSR